MPDAPARGPRARVAAVIQARMTSTRLPGKVLRPLHGRPALGWVLRAANEAGVFDQVVVATSDRAEDDVLAEVAQAAGASVVRGPEDDVLTRYIRALDEFPADTVVRLTADCPLLDPAVIRLAVSAFQAAEGSLDYLSTVLSPSLPRGLDVEVVSARCLRETASWAGGVDRVHVTSAIYGDPERHCVAGLAFAPDAHDLRVTLDTEDDLRLLERVVEEIGDRAPSWRELVTLLRGRPDITALNAHVQQKAIHEG